VAGGTKRSYETNTTTNNDSQQQQQLAIDASFVLLKSTVDASPKKGDDAFDVLINASKRKKKKDGQPDNKYNFPATCKNALKRKQNVNLYINNGEVVLAFTYNLPIIDVIKTIKGRRWDKTVGVKGSWVFPLETLPQCVALYQFMGREPEREIKERAKKITDAYNGASAADAIEIVISLYVKENLTDKLGVGVFSFYYDKDVVEALKQLPPSCRNYNPMTKAWTVDLLALPHVLEFLLPIGYKPSKELNTVIDTIACIDNMLHGSEYNNANANGEESFQSPVKSNSNDMESSFEAEMVASAEKAEMAHEQQKQQNKELKITVEKLVTILQNSKHDAVELDRSDVGQAKQRRLTSSQRAYAGLDDGDFIRVMFDRLSSLSNNKQDHSGCGCGRPSVKINGIHTCRYFGKFECSCGNEWTSAYCWEGESQSCKSCNRESLPVVKERLKKNGGNKMCKNTVGAHDSARCTMCQRLGHSCSALYTS